MSAELKDVRATARDGGGFMGVLVYDGILYCRSAGAIRWRYGADENVQNGDVERPESLSGMPFRFPDAGVGNAPSTRRAAISITLSYG